MLRKKHFIITLGRSGSNTLVDLLNQNPAILNVGEVLGDWMPIRKAQKFTKLYKDNDSNYLDALLGDSRLQWSANLIRSIGKIRQRRIRDVKKFKEIRSIGIKEFSLNIHNLGLTSYLKLRPDVKVIGLIRSNPIDRMISSFLLGETGVISHRIDSHNEKYHKKMYIDPIKAIEDINILDLENKKLTELISDLPDSRLFIINYEEFFSSLDRNLEIMNNLQEFIGVSPVKTKIRMTKIIPGDPLDVLDNASDVRDAILKSKFSEFI